MLSAGFLHVSTIDIWEHNWVHCPFSSFSVLCSQRLTPNLASGVCSWVTGTALPIGADCWECLSCQGSLELVWSALGCNFCSSLPWGQTEIGIWLVFSSLLLEGINKSAAPPDKYFEEMPLAVIWKREGWLGLHENKTGSLTVEHITVLWSTNISGRACSPTFTQRRKSSWHIQYRLASAWRSGCSLFCKTVHFLSYGCNYYKSHHIMSPNGPPMNFAHCS